MKNYIDKRFIQPSPNQKTRLVSMIYKVQKDKLQKVISGQIV